MIPVAELGIADDQRGLTALDFARLAAQTARKNGELPREAILLRIASALETEFSRRESIVLESSPPLASEASAAGCKIRI